MEKLKLKLCTSTSSQCNFFVREKTTKYVQVKPDVRSKAVSVSLKPEVCQSCNEKVIQVQTESTVKRRGVVDRGTQHNSTEVLPIAIERILYVLRTMPAYGCLQYEVVDCDSQKVLLITAPSLFTIKFMPVHPVCIMVYKGELSYLVAFKPKEVVDLWGHDKFDFEAVFRELNRLVDASTKQVCSGFVPESDSNYTTNSLVKMDWPYCHWRARDCALLYDKDKQIPRVMCQKCAALQQTVHRAIKRKCQKISVCDETSVSEAKRERTSSNNDCEL